MKRQKAKGKNQKAKVEERLRLFLPFAFCLLIF
jgi:hypothetical protein